MDVSKDRFVFPTWVDKLRPLLLGGLLVGPVYLVAVVGFGASPKTTDVGYAPIQPVPFSHALHAGKLGMDCRYCHTTVEKAAFAAIPPTQTCMNCHSMIKTQSEKLKPVRDAYATGEPIPWVKVHDLPDYAYFNHSAHVTRGVSCVECHGRIDTMEVVQQAKPLSMSWCLDCHRDPIPHLRPQEHITDLDWAPPEGISREEIGQKVADAHKIHPSTNCSTCHR